MLPPDDRDPVDVLAEEFADLLRRGERPRAIAAHADASEIDAHGIDGIFRHDLIEQHQQGITLKKPCAIAWALRRKCDEGKIRLLLDDPRNAMSLDEMDVMAALA